MSTVDPKSARRRPSYRTRRGENRHRPIDTEHAGLLDLATALYDRRIWEESSE
jgi:hypothetical protein